MKIKNSTEGNEQHCKVFLLVFALLTQARFFYSLMARKYVSESLKPASAINDQLCLILEICFIQNTLECNYKPNAWINIPPFLFSSSRVKEPLHYNLVPRKMHLNWEFKPQSRCFCITTFLLMLFTYLLSKWN